MAARASALEQITFVDLYAEYPRFKIDVDREQKRLLQHDIIVLQFPLMWYSTPSLLKEWQDLVLEYGFAYGENGNKLVGKTLALAVTTGSPQEAYTSGGFQNHELHTLLSPLSQMGNLCQTRSLPPYVLFGAHSDISEAAITPHVDGYCQYLSALRDGTIKRRHLRKMPLFTFADLPKFLEPNHD